MLVRPCGLVPGIVACLALVPGCRRNGSEKAMAVPHSAPEARRVDPGRHPAADQNPGRDRTEFRIGPHGPSWLFILKPDDAPVHGPERAGMDGTPCVIEVHQPGKAGSAQEIQVFVDLMFEALSHPLINSLSTDDFNFDGYQDLKVQSWSGATGNTGYSVFLYRPSLGRFVYNKELSTIGNPKADPEAKVINGRWNGGHAGRIGGQETYRWIRGTPVLVERVETDWLEKEKVYLQTTSARRGGKLVVLRRDRLPADD